MDLSGIIFVALAIGWAVYLIPKALQREDEKALSRSVDSFSDSLRVLGRRGGSTEPAVHGERPVSAVEERERRASPVVEEGEGRARLETPYRVSRETARAAARRRRRVLGILVVALLATVATSAFGVTSWWSSAVPGGLVVVFLLTAAIAVRAQQARRFAAYLEEASGPIPGLPLNRLAAEADTEPDLTGEDTVAVAREELAASVAAPTTDEGALWDPLPITLPTYVGKPRANRTVRTIELTQGGVTSSGHDAADSALARRAAAEDTAHKTESGPEDDGQAEPKAVNG